MKKYAVRIVVALVVVLVVVVLCIGLFLDGAVKSAVETLGPRLTKTDVKLQSVSLSLLSGSGSIKGFVLGNPEGYKTPSAIQVGQARLAVKPSSLFGDKIVVKTINVQAPEITFETDLKGNNLSKIIANLDSFSSGTDTKTDSKNKGADRKLQVDEFVVQGGKINVSVTALGGKSVTVPLPEIQLRDLGQGPEGITAAELSKKVLKTVLEQATQAASGAVANLGKEALDLTKGLGKDAADTAGQAAEKATKGIGDIFKKKK